MNRRRRAIAALIALVVLVAVAAWLASRSSTSPTAAQTTSPTTAPMTTAPTTAPTSASTAAGRASSSSSIDPETKLLWIDADALPTQARQVLALIDKGGPYAYSQDGGTFGNFEGLLPKKARGFYTEYTVPTPGSKDRGARRIIMGGEKAWFFWTDDHYQSFARIRR